MENINPIFIPKRKRQYSVAEYVEQIKAGNRMMLSQAITLIESTQIQHKTLGTAIVEACLPFSGNSVRIGITGTPGVGKSTFIEALGKHLLQAGKRVAVLAIDPTSHKNKGSILGDKTRMLHLSNDERAFIRPTPSGTALGGVARSTREALLLCEAAGYDVIIVETVGVGQSEISVYELTDFFLLLLQPGAGDELQGIKRGIVEMADLLAVNKADGERAALAKQAKQAYRNALQLFPAKESTWKAQVITCSALSGVGIADIWQLINDYLENTQKNGYWEKRRNQQAQFWLQESLKNGILEWLEQSDIKKMKNKLANDVLNGKISPFSAAEMILATLKKILKNSIDEV